MRSSLAARLDRRHHARCGGARGARSAGRPAGAPYGCRHPVHAVRRPTPGSDRVRGGCACAPRGAAPCLPRRPPCAPPQGRRAPRAAHRACRGSARRAGAPARRRAAAPRCRAAAPGGPRWPAPRCPATPAPAGALPQASVGWACCWPACARPWNALQASRSCPSLAEALALAGRPYAQAGACVPRRPVLQIRPARNDLPACQSTWKVSWRAGRAAPAGRRGARAGPRLLLARLQAPVGL